MNDRLKLAWRLAVTAVCAVILIVTVTASVEMFADWLDSRNWGQNIEDYDYYLYEGDYRGLRDWLSSGQPRREEFQVYWDVADAYQCYSVYEFWGQAQENGLEAGEYREEYLERLLRIYENSSEAARRHIRSFAEELVR